MLDIKFIRENPKIVQEACKNKNVDIDINNVLQLDKEYREKLRAKEEMQAKKNKSSKQIFQSKDDLERKKIILEMQELDKNNDRLSELLKEQEKELNVLLLKIPNIPFDSVPIGKSDKDNVVLRKVGKETKFKFPFKDYLELGEKLDIIDVKRAANVSGSRFGYLKREAALIEIALINLAFDILTKKDFIPVIPPVMIKENIAQGTGFLEATDRQEAYFFQDDNLYLAGTSEQSLVGMHANEIFNEKDLPIRYVAFSTCFRREAGSYGKDTKGILRVHQFDKIEMVVFSKPEEAKKEHELLLSLEEQLMKLLKLPHQVVNICTGDLGRPAVAKYDIETWIPSENKYRETHSTSNCTDFQARRLNIRYRDKDNQTHFVHTQNGTTFAIGRILIAIIENYQQKDGSIKIPVVLQKYLKFKTIKNDRRKNIN